MPFSNGFEYSKGENPPGKWVSLNGGASRPPALQGGAGAIIEMTTRRLHQKMNFALSILTSLALSPDPGALVLLASGLD